MAAIDRVDESNQAWGVQSILFATFGAVLGGDCRQMIMDKIFADRHSTNKLRQVSKALREQVPCALTTAKEAEAAFGGRFKHDDEVSVLEVLRHFGLSLSITSCNKFFKNWHWRGAQGRHATLAYRDTILGMHVQLMKTFDGNSAIPMGRDVYAHLKHKQEMNAVAKEGRRTAFLAKKKAAAVETAERLRAATSKAKGGMHDSIHKMRVSGNFIAKSKAESKALKSAIRKGLELALREEFSVFEKRHERDVDQPDALIDGDGCVADGDDETSEIGVDEMEDMLSNASDWSE